MPGTRSDATSDDDSVLVIRPLGQPGDLGWVVQSHGEIYADEFGWDTSFEALVAKIVADYADDHDEAREAAWIAEADGERVGCVFLVNGGEELAKLRILLVHPKGRGRGVGDRLVSTCLDFAREVGYRRITLWTNDILVAARRIYERHGFELVDQERHHSFGHDLVGQNWTRDLEQNDHSSPSPASAVAVRSELSPAATKLIHSRFEHGVLRT